MVTAPPTLIEPSKPEGGWPGHPLFSLENLYRAYRMCRRRKRGTHNALKFERRLEDNLVDLHRELEGGSYRPGRFLAFLLGKPKRREIFAADFRDRVVHHVLVGHQERFWERRFIHDSFACRKGKGTLAGVERLRSFTRKATANGTRRAFYLQLDVRSFFMALDRRVLWQRLAAHERDPAVLWLMRLILSQDPPANCRLRRARQADFDSLPQRFALRFKDQVACFEEQLPGHVLMVQKGVFWQAVVPGSVATRAPAGALPVADGQRVRRSSTGSAAERRLWQSGAPVAWIGETGRRLTNIAERALVCRWGGGGGGELGDGEPAPS